MLSVKKSFIICEWNRVEQRNRILAIKLPWKDKIEFYFKMLKFNFYHCQNIIKHNTLFEMCWKWS